MLTEKILQKLMKELTMRQQEEMRCRRCHERETCPAFDTDVMYPCPYFEEEVNHGTEE